MNSIQVIITFLKIRIIKVSTLYDFTSTTGNAVGFYGEIIWNQKSSANENVNLKL